MAQRPRERRTPVDEQLPSLQRNVLVIDDDDDSREVLLYQLSLEGYARRGAATGISGVRAARVTAPDCIVLDLNLPDMHGIQVIEALRAEPALAETPIVVVSGERRVVGERAVAAGASAFHAKPLDFGGLLATLRFFGIQGVPTVS